MKTKSIKERIFELEENPEASAKDWELLAGDCLAVEDYQSAARCFERANVIKEKRTYSTYGRTKKELAKFVAAPWDQSAVEV